MGKLIELKSHKPFEIKCKSDTTAEIMIYNDIGGWDYDSISAKSFSDELKSLPETVSQINVRVNSPGGDVFDGITIYNRLKRHSAKVTVHVDGLAASIASIIALAGDEVVMSEGAMFMIHDPYTMAMGNARELESVVDRLVDVGEQLVSIYNKKTKIDKNELRQMMAKETWLDADQSVELGFATSKIEDEAVLIAASLDKASWIRSKPTVNNKKIKSQIANFKNDIEGFLARKK